MSGAQASLVAWAVAGITRWERFENILNGSFAMLIGDGFTGRELIRLQQLEIVHLASRTGTNEALLSSPPPDPEQGFSDPSDGEAS